jgi:hypothetical protein
LLGAGADVNQVDPQDGTFPLLMALTFGDLRIVSALVLAGATSPFELSMDKLEETAAKCVLEPFTELAWPDANLLADAFGALDQGLEDNALGAFLLWQVIGMVEEGVIRGLRAQRIACFPNHRLIEALIDHGDHKAVYSALIGSRGGYLLGGESASFHILMAREGRLVATDNAEHMASYLKVFCAYVHGEDGPYRIVEDIDDLGLLPSCDAEERAKIVRLIRPLEYLGKEEAGHLFSATVCYAEALFHVQFKVLDDGNVEMTEDELIISDMAVMQHRFDGPKRIVFHPTVADQPVQASTN